MANTNEISLEDKRTKLLEAPVEGLILRLAIPTIISMLISSFYNMADTYFVGRTEDSIVSTGAVGVVFSLMAVIQAFGFLFGHGSGNYMSRRLGSGDTEDAAYMANTGFFTALIIGSLISIVGIIFIKPLALLLGSTELILPKAIDYMTYILLGAPFFMGSLVLNNQLRYQGSAFFAMIGITTGAILNMILTPLFIFKFNLDVKGAGIGTCISQIMSFIVLIIGVYKSDAININIKKFKPSIDKYKEMIAGGVPSLFRQSIASLATICLNFSAQPFGEVAIASMAIVSRIIMFANSAVVGFGQGFQPVCGFNFGAGRYDRVLKAFWFCVKLSLVVLAIISVIGYIFAPDLVAIFSKGSSSVHDIGGTALRFQCILFPINSFMVISNMLLQTIRKPIKASILAISRQGIIFIPLVIVLPKFLGIRGIQIAQPISDLVTLMLAIIIQIPVLKELKRGYIEEN